MKASHDNPYRIVHFSDLHLTAGDRDSRTEPTLADRLTGMNENFRRLLRTDAIRQADLLIITGDISDNGRLEAWQQFNQALCGAGVAGKTLVVLGNHDVCELAARVGLPKDLKKADLARARKGLAMCRQPTKYPWAVVVAKDRVVVFGLDSNNSGNLSVVTNAVGRIGFQQLAALACLLHKHRDVPIKIVALHHSPNIPGKATSIRRGRRPAGLMTRWAHEVPPEDRHGLRLLCMAHRVRLVLHGHLHSAEDRAVNGVRIVGTPATTQPVMKGERSSDFQFFQYTIRWPAGRVERSLRTVTLADLPRAK
jgi:3',5'-cyclic AMP phosphodiesterase CpdA